MHWWARWEVYSIKNKTDNCTVGNNLLTSDWGETVRDSVSACNDGTCPLVRLVGRSCVSAFTSSKPGMEESWGAQKKKHTYLSDCR